jgi:DNA-binding NtrC family response regulator
MLMDFSWPGNVRELQNIIERAITLSAHETLDVSDFHLDAASSRSSSSSSAAGAVGAGALAPLLPEGKTLEEWEHEIIRAALARANGNKSQAARALGLTRNALRYRLSAMGAPDSAEGES